MKSSPDSDEFGKVRSLICDMYWPLLNTCIGKSWIWAGGVLILAGALINGGRD